MIDLYLKDFLQKPSTKYFLEAANELVEFLEGAHEKSELYEYLRNLQKQLAKYYFAGCELEEVDLNYYDGNDSQVEGVSGKINYSQLEKMGKDDLYCEVYDPTCYNIYLEKDNLDDIGKEVTQGWLLDDLSDIYNDLNPYISTLKKSQKNEEIEDALFQLHFSFNQHSGKHCIDAMRFLHHYIRN